MPKKANLEDLEELRKRPGKIHKIIMYLNFFIQFPGHSLVTSSIYTHRKSSK